MGIQSWRLGPSSENENQKLPGITPTTVKDRLSRSMVLPINSGSAPKRLRHNPSLCTATGAAPLAATVPTLARAGGRQAHSALRSTLAYVGTYRSPLGPEGGT